MSSQPDTPPPADAPIIVPVLNMHERRVLGVLVEKAKTTPDAYPLSLNALTTGCNQKSNRDPILDLTDLDVEAALASCQKQLLAIRITGVSRVERWRHNLYDSLLVGKVELAILAELMLRGAQTEGELRTRASRMEPIADLDTLRSVLRKLAERKLIVYLTPEGRRGTTVTHGFYAPEELDGLRSRHGGSQTDESPSQPSTSVQSSSAHTALETQVSALQAQFSALQAQVTELEKTTASLGEQIRDLKSALGA